MSSSFATIPKTAPFTEEDVDLLNRVVGPAVADPARLARRLSRRRRVGAGDGAAQPAAPARPAEPLTIVYASESGNCEKLAGDLAKAARKNGLKPTIVDMADLDLSRALPSTKRLVVIAATWGEGEPPARAVRAYGELMGEGAPRLDGVEFGVLALGDTAYAEFCAIGKTIDERLAALGAKRVVDRVDCDLDFAEPAGALDRRRAQGAGAAGRRRPRTRHRGRFRRQAGASPNTDIVEAEITEHINLNSSRSDKETMHLALAFDGARRPTSRATRSISMPRTIRPMSTNCSKRAGLPGDATLRDRAHQDRATSPRCRSRRSRPMPAQTGHHYVKALIADGEAQGLDRRPPAHRPDRDLPDRAHRRAAARASRGRWRRAPIRSRRRAARSATRRIC